MARQRRHFIQEHKDEIVRMVLDGPHPIAHVACEVGIHDTASGNRVRDYRRRHGGDASTGSTGGEKNAVHRGLPQSTQASFREQVSDPS
ncbi:transposase [Actinomadura xylanilytica]|uniref:transposase n=1 Tax=Actinomadura xylanilytica TaxID=887459 RepID=UPI00255B3AAF|nr:transposase [Actinomadura xylanilytica]MDL4777336.1 transposase [Actinomadura xylanilytica]